ncbi:MAG: HisA/HisF-related TIM barrel protein [Actinomycetota bacterium]
MLTGPDVAGLRALVGVAPAPVVASGGVGSEDDLVALASVAGLDGVIVGRAIYEGRVDVARAVEVLR